MHGYVSALYKCVCKRASEWVATRMCMIMSVLEKGPKKAARFSQLSTIHSCMYLLTVFIFQLTQTAGDVDNLENR